MKLGMTGGVGSCISMAPLFKKLNKQTLCPTTLHLQTRVVFVDFCCFEAFPVLSVTMFPTQFKNKWGIFNSFKM